MDQVTDINEYLRKDLHVYIRPPKVVKKGEEQTLLKRPSFIGEEAGKVIENLESLIIRLNQGKKISAVQKLEIAAADEFMLMYNLVSVRVENAQDPAQRRTKAVQVGRQASKFIKAYTKAFGNGAACTVYIHYVAHHLAQHINNIPCDIMELSGQALEHCNQLRKQHGQLTSKNPTPWTHVKKDGKRKVGMMDELMVHEELSRWFEDESEYKGRPSPWMRMVQTQGRNCGGLVKKEPVEWVLEEE